jgi:N-hydroxyarylamine O-acetyltransferase
MTPPTIDVDRYLTRIGWDGERPPAPTLEHLVALQLAHMTTVPFENLHVVAGHPMPTSLDWSVPKVVDERRGGWCFEINGAFGALLAALGYDVALHSAQVWDPSATELGPELDHLCLIVRVDGVRWLVDAGFGDSSVTPVSLDTADEQVRLPRRARVEHDDAGRILYLEWMHFDEWEVQYGIDPTPRELADFQPRSDELASGAGGGYFSEKPFATRALGGDGDRVWLSRDRLKVRRGDGHQAPTEAPVAAEEWPAVLAEWFGMEPVSRRTA